MNAYEVDKAIRGGMPFSAVVDIDGVFNPRTGGFHVVQDAIDAGHLSIFVRAGTYDTPFEVTLAGCRIRGEGRGTLITNANDTAVEACRASAAGVHVSDMAFQTESGGGGGGQEAVVLAAANCKLSDFWVEESDDDGVLMGSAEQEVSRGYIFDCDDIGIRINSSGDNGRAVNNKIKDQGGNSIDIDAAGENCVVVGNRTDGAINDASGTSTVTGNDETAF